MRNLIIYLVFAFVPFIFVIWSLSLGYEIFIISLVVFYLYRALIDGIRLKNKGVIAKEDLWKSFIPFYKIEKMKELYRK